MSRIENARRPRGIGGILTLRRMNKGAHARLSEWGFVHFTVECKDDCLDIGCGGGANLKRLLSKSTHGTVTGVDYSETSVSKSIRTNRSAVKAGRCRVVQGDVMDLPFEDESFDIVTAFETVYFWPDIGEAFKGVFRVMRPGGMLMVCNEADGENSEDLEWTHEAGLRVYSKDELTEALEKRASPIYAWRGSPRSAGSP
ncbi:MAG: class I SAM-dependent methyltransferase [Thermoplasmata archaeon]|nr:class I SAM-dependent methyltransferase [Thermoplasmata archaeon]